MLLVNFELFSFLWLVSNKYHSSGCECYVCFVGMVTAEMFQSKQGTDVMSKMVEDLDEVCHSEYSVLIECFPVFFALTDAFM